MDILHHHWTLPLAAAWIPLFVALLLDWSGVGEQSDRDIVAMALAAPGMAGLLAGLGWPQLVAGVGSAAGTVAAVVVVASFAVLVVVLVGGKRTPRRLNRAAWGCVTTICLAWPAIHPVVGKVYAWPWGDPQPLLAGFLLVGWACVWLWAAGWRPHMIVTRSPGRAGGLLSPAKAQLTRDSDSDSDSDSGRDSAPAGAARSDRAEAGATAGVARFAGARMGADSPIVVVGAPTGRFEVARAHFGWSWGVWWRRMWAHAAPEASPATLPLDLNRPPAWHQWMGRQLQAGAAPTDIVRVARDTWHGGEATWWRRLAQVRRDLGLPAQAPKKHAHLRAVR